MPVTATPPSSAGQGLKFYILGPLEVWSDGKRLSLGGMRAERVLATLLLEANRMVPVSRLVEAAWDEEPPATAAHQVRKVVADLRRRFVGHPRLLATDGPGYRMVLAEDQLDLNIFEVRLSRAREADIARLPGNAVAQLQAALKLWRGPPLAGMQNSIIEAAVVRLNERRLTAVERLMELRLGQGESRGVVAELRALVAEYPLRETIRGQLMLALHRSGRQAEALQVYTDGRRMLATELGIDPGWELVRLHEQILRNDPELELPPARQQGTDSAEPPTVIPVDTPRPRSLPHDLPDFVGRTEELERLTGQVRSAVGRGLVILTIDGMAGVGKTTLAVHAAHWLAEDFPDGQLFLDLHGYTPGRDPLEPAEALHVLLRAWGVPSGQIPDDLTARSALWRVQAAGKKLMVLLDNAADTGQVRALLPGASGCLVMVTSRPRLAGLDGAVSISLDLPPPEEGLALLTEVLGSDRVAQAPQDTEALVEVCGRLPLAIRIAAARLHNRPQWTISYLVDRLRNEERRVGELMVDDRSVAAAIGLSYQSLGADHRRMFRLLGLHPDAELDTYGAAALADTSVELAESLLEDLLDVRLLTQRQLGRYAFHDILRSYARSAAIAEEAENQRVAAFHRLLDYYLFTANRAADLVQPGRFPVELSLTYTPGRVPTLADRSAAMAWFDDERSALVAAVRHAQVQGLYQHACHLPRALAYFLQLRGHMQDLQAVMEIAVEASCRLGDQVFQGRSLINLSIPHWHFGRFAEALDCAERALDIASEVGDVPNEGMCLGRIGMLLNSLGRYGEALGYYERALVIYRRTGAQREEGRALTSISIAHAAFGRYAEALLSARRAVEINRELGDRGGEAIGLVNEASAHAGLGDYPAAMSALDRALELARSVGTPNGEAVVVAHYADLYRRLGRHDEAYETGRRALRMLQTIRRPALSAAVENTLGSVHHARGEYELALERHERALRLAEKMGFRIELARALDGMARALHALGDVEAANQHWRLATAHYEEMGVPGAAPAPGAPEPGQGTAGQT